MNELVINQAATVSDTLLALADSFGLFATLYIVKRDTQAIVWEKQALHSRSVTCDADVLITVRTACGQIGQAIADHVEEEAIISAFHQARENLSEHPLRSQCLDRFHHLEQRYPAPLPFTADKLVWEEEALVTRLEQHHLHLGSLRSTLSLRTSLFITREQFLVARSDGAMHQDVLWRVRCEHQFSSPPYAPTIRVHSGLSAPSCAEWVAEELVLALLDQLEQTSLPSPFTRSTLPTTTLDLAQEKVQIAIDAHGMAELLLAWLALPQRHYETSAATLFVEPHEGLLGYHPFHPFGYLLAPSMILSRTGADKPYVEALRTSDVPFASHLTLQLTELGDPTSQALSANQTARLLKRRGLVTDDDFLLTEGVERFYVDPCTASFTLLPTHLYHIQDGTLANCPPVWLSGSCAALWTACIGGLGPAKLIYSTTHENWSVSVPTYSFVIFGKGER